MGKQVAGGGILTHEFKHITLSLDLSLSSPGFAVLAVTSDGHPLILEKTHITTRSTKPHGYRLNEIADEIRRYMKKYEPAHVVREKGFSRFPATTQALFKVVGVSDLIVSENYTHKTIEEIAPTSVKKLVTGNGKATKKQVEQAVLERLQIDQPNFFANDDESDAAAVGLAYFIEKGMID